MVLPIACSRIRMPVEQPALPGCPQIIRNQPLLLFFAFFLGFFLRHFALLLGWKDDHARRSLAESRTIQAPERIRRREFREMKILVDETEEKKKSFRSGARHGCD